MLTETKLADENNRLRQQFGSYIPPRHSTAPYLPEEHDGLEGTYDPYKGFVRALAKGEVLVDISRLNLGQVEPFSGIANISLDGTVTTLEGRGEGDRAVIVLTAGGKAIDCFVDRIPDSKLREIWKKRCTVLGIGHYSGNRNLPDYIEAVSIEPVGDGSDWRQWRGAFSPLRVDESDWD